MSPTELLINLTGGVRNPNFFNGRVLTAQDLVDQQVADQRHRRQLCKALGEGVVFGFEVETTGQPAVIRVSCGLAVNRDGEMLALEVDTLDISLETPPESAASSAGEGRFTRCSKLSPQLAPTSAGYYLLIARPVSDYSAEKVPMVGLEPPGVATGCGHRYLDEGIRFGLLALSTANAGVQLPSAADAVDVTRKRNLLAYRCFGVAWLEKFGDDPFAVSKGESAYRDYGLIDELRQPAGGHATGPLSDCDLPLALIYWTGNGVGFVDMWSVRRRLVQPPVSAFWPMHAGQRRLAESEATFLQFQAQLDAIRASGRSADVRATEWFRYLPAAGYLPLGGSDFSSDTFFAGLDVDRWKLDPALLRLLVQQSWSMAPIDLEAPQIPRILLYTPAAENPGYLLFMRADTSGPVSVEVATPPSDTTGSTETAPASKPRTGEIDVLLLQNPKDTIPRVRLDVDVWAVAEKDLRRSREKRYPAVPVAGPTIGGHNRSLQSEGARKFVIDDLPPGRYLVMVSVTGFRNASRQVVLRAGQRQRVEFTLVKEKDKPDRGTKQPPGGIPADWLKEWYGELYALKEKFDWPWPPEVWIDRPPFPDPIPEEIVGPLQELARELYKDYPDAPVDPGDIRIYRDAGHNPDVIAEQPYAYAVFGDGGGFVPLILTAGNRTFGYQVPLAKGTMAGADDFVLGKLETAGLGTLDVLAAGWSGLIADTLGISVDAASSLIVETRGKVDTLVGDSLMGHSGVTEVINTALNRLGVKNDFDLANRDPQSLYDDLQNTNVGDSMSKAFVQRIVDEARNSLSKEAWSLDSPALGLHDDEVDALNGKGFGTQGALLKAIEKAQAEGTEAELGAFDVERVKVSINTSFDRRAVANVARTPITTMEGMTRGMARDLANMHLATTGRLATANVNTVAALFDGDQARAQDLIDRAKAFNESALGAP